jgi:hypothetical protein
MSIYDSEGAILNTARATTASVEDVKPKYITLIGEKTGTYTAGDETFIHLSGSSDGTETTNGRYFVTNKKIRLKSAKCWTIRNQFTDLGANFMDVYLFTGDTLGGGIGGGSWVELDSGTAFTSSLTDGTITGIIVTLTKGQMPMWATLTNAMGGTATGFHIESVWEILEE